MSEWISEWISVEVKPKEDCSVLIASNYGVRSGHFLKDWNGKFQDHVTHNDEGRTDISGKPFKPTHWMPLPSPPEGEKPMNSDNQWHKNGELPPAGTRLEYTHCDDSTGICVVLATVEPNLLWVQFEDKLEPETRIMGEYFKLAKTQADVDREEAAAKMLRVYDCGCKHNVDVHETLYDAGYRNYGEEVSADDLIDWWSDSSHERFADFIKVNNLHIFKKVARS